MHLPLAMGEIDRALLEAIEPMLRVGDWGGARRYLQKIAYGMPDAEPHEREAFTLFMAAFARSDPLYKACVAALRPVLAESPQGVKQTALYPHMAGAPDVETARYVLYYADVLGDVVRKKKGNSYTVFAPQTAVPATAPAPAPASAPTAPAMSMSISFSVRDMSDYRRLNREATQAKGRDWARAVALLQEAKALEGDRYFDTRLAKFLQEAGRFEEALAEIQWLLDRVELRLPSVSGSKRARHRARLVADIHHDAALICRREGRDNLAAEHRRREKALLEIVDKLDALP